MENALYQKLIDPHYSFQLNENIYHRFRFPFKIVNPGDRVILYGGGVVGKIFLQQIKNSGYCTLVGVCDRSPDETGIVEIPTFSLSELVNIPKKQYDVILIAIEKKSVAMEIRENLLLAGIPKKKIKWCDPSNQEKRIHSQEKIRPQQNIKEESLSSEIPKVQNSDIKNDQETKLEEKQISDSPQEPQISDSPQEQGTQFVTEFLTTRFRDLQKIQCLTVDSNIKRINIVLDSLEKNTVFGGVATDLIIVTLLAKKMKRKLRIITRSGPMNPRAYQEIIKMNGITELDDVEFYSDCNRNSLGNSDTSLEVGENEIFVASIWWTAYAIRKTFPMTKMIYILQEVETFFYPHGDEHFLCRSMMEDKNIIYVVNSHYLHDYFKVHEKNVYENSISFEPAFTENLYHISEHTFQEERNKYTLFFYARPNHPRNLFYRGIYLLDKGIERGIIDTKIWDIHCLGEKIPRLSFCNGYKLMNDGILDWRGYGQFLSEVDLTLSLMYTPHPSYPPYDALCSGSVVLTNTYENKSEFPTSDNMFMSNLEIEDFLEKLEAAVALAMNKRQRLRNFQKMNVSRSWENSLEDTILFLERKFSDYE